MRTYVVWCPDLGQEQEDGATIPATDPADAAEGWAEWHDRSSAEYRIVSGREEIVIVRDVETGEQREWIVRGYHTRTALKLPALHWVIVGGESGPNARPMHREWARSLRDQCVDAGVPFFFKQWGEWAPNRLCNLEMDMAHRETKRPEPGKPGVMFRCGKQAAGRLLDGRTWDEVPK